MGAGGGGVALTPPHGAGGKRNGRGVWGRCPRGGGGAQEGAGDRLRWCAWGSVAGGEWGGGLAMTGVEVRKGWAGRVGGLLVVGVGWGAGMQKSGGEMKGGRRG